MKDYAVLIGLILFAAVSLAGAGRDHGREKQKKTVPSVRTERTIHSNAPGTIDRDLGRARALEVGRGKKYGLKRMLPVPPRRVSTTPRASTRVYLARKADLTTKQATRRTHTRKGPKR